MNRQKKQAIFGRRRQERTAIHPNSLGPAPKAGIVDLERHLQRSEARVRLNRCPTGLPEDDFLALQAMEQIKLRDRHLSRARIAEILQGRNRLRQILVVDEEVQIPELAKPKITKHLDGKERTFERNCFDPVLRQSVEQSDELVKQRAVCPAGLVRYGVERTQNIVWDVIWRQARERLRCETRNPMGQRLLGKRCPIDAIRKQLLDRRLLLLRVAGPGRRQEKAKFRLQLHAVRPLLHDVV